MRTIVRCIAVASCLALVAVLGAQPFGSALGTAAVGSEQEPLARMVGDWNIEVSFLGAPSSKGTSSIRTMGTWSVEHVDSSLMGQPFQGCGITGWDPAKKKYVGVWADSSETQLNHSELVWDEAAQSLVGDPEEHDMGSGPVLLRGVTRLESRDRMVSTLTPVEGDAQPVLTIAYTRKK